MCVGVHVCGCQRLAVHVLSSPGIHNQRCSPPHGTCTRHCGQATWPRASCATAFGVCALQTRGQGLPVTGHAWLVDKWVGNHKGRSERKIIHRRTRAPCKTTTPRQVDIWLQHHDTCVHLNASCPSTHRLTTGHAYLPSCTVPANKCSEVEQVPKPHTPGGSAPI